MPSRSRIGEANREQSTETEIKQLVNSSTRLLVYLSTYYQLVYLSTRLLVYSSTRQLKQSTRLLVNLSTRQQKQPTCLLVNLSTRQLKQPTCLLVYSSTYILNQSPTFLGKIEVIVCLVASDISDDSQKRRHLHIRMA